MSASATYIQGLSYSVTRGGLNQYFKGGGAYFFGPPIASLKIKQKAVNFQFIFYYLHISRFTYKKLNIFIEID